MFATIDLTNMQEANLRGKLKAECRPDLVCVAIENDVATKEELSELSKEEIIDLLIENVPDIII